MARAGTELHPCSLPPCPGWLCQVWPAQVWGRALAQPGECCRASFPRDSPVSLPCPALQPGTGLLPTAAPGELCLYQISLRSHTGAPSSCHFQACTHFPEAALGLNGRKLRAEFSPGSTFLGLTWDVQKQSNCTLISPLPVLPWVCCPGPSSAQCTLAEEGLCLLAAFAACLSTGSTTQHLQHLGSFQISHMTLS